MEEANLTPEQKKKLYQKNYRKLRKEADPDYRVLYNSYMLSYYNKHKEPTECPCGGRYIKSNTQYHKSTKKHLTYESSIKPIMYEKE